MKAKRIFTLSALLAVVFMLVALLFGSTIGATTAKAEEVAFEPVSYRYVEDEMQCKIMQIKSNQIKSKINDLYISYLYKGIFLEKYINLD